MLNLEVAENRGVTFSNEQRLQFGSDPDEPYSQPFVFNRAGDMTCEIITVYVKVRFGTFSPAGHVGTHTDFHVCLDFLAVEKMQLVTLYDSAVYNMLLFSSYTCRLLVVMK